MDTNKDLEVQNEEVGTSKTYEKEVKRGATIMQKVIKARSSGIKFEVYYIYSVCCVFFYLFLGFRACTYYMSLLGWLEREWSAS